MAALQLSFEDWPYPLLDHPLTPAAGSGSDIQLTSRYLTVAEQPTALISGELHYSRVPRSQWRNRLQLMKSGGINVVATYVLWIHHQPEPGPANFSDNLDLAAFVAEALDVGLKVVLRIGPWCHAETRNGGFPDWIVDQPVQHRTNDPEYLRLAADWFAQLGAQLAPLFATQTGIIGVQLENELYDQADHLLALRDLAVANGITPPLWLATAWGYAQLPPDDVFPLFGGYADGFWTEWNDGWADSFRAHFFFSRAWDDPGIGADVRGEFITAQHVTDDARFRGSVPFPPATCELGGGMATAYHNRPVLTGRDTAAVANTKLGNGSVWQGYYMYAGGLNPRGRTTFQETQATGYPNDVPAFDYDFGAPIGAAGVLQDTHAELRIQHAFLAAFGNQLVQHHSSLPEELPADLQDTQTMRWAARWDGNSGFLFINWHQPYEQLPTYSGAQFSLRGVGGTEITLPDAPLDIPGGTVARWPINLVVAGGIVHWATASAVTVLADGTLVLLAEDGIPVRVSVAATAGQDPIVTEVTPGTDPQRLGGISLLVLPAGMREQIWVLAESWDSAPQLVLSADPVWLEGGVLRSWQQQRDAEEVDVVQIREAGDVPASYGAQAGRASAPSDETVAELGARWELRGLGEVSSDPVTQRRILQLDWVGDVAQLVVAGRVVHDRFWDGTPWFINLDDLQISESVELRVLPLHPQAQVKLPRPAQKRLQAADHEARLVSARLSYEMVR